MVAIIVIAIVAILIIWVISVQRKLVKQEEICKNGLSQIGVQQASRWDALSAIADLIKGYSEHEYKTITDTIAQRRPINAASSTADANAQENLFTQAMSALNVVVEKYPDLKANEQFNKGIDNVNLYENQVRMSRMVYNDTVTVFNREVRQFPTNLVAKMLGFAEKDYLKVEAAKTEMPSMKI